MKKTALKWEKERLEERYFLGSPDMKVPHDFAGFLCNGSNKEMFLSLFSSLLKKKNLHSDQRTPSDSSSKLQTTKKLTQS